MNSLKLPTKCPDQQILDGLKDERPRPLEYQKAADESVCREIIEVRIREGGGGRGGRVRV